MTAAQRPDGKRSMRGLTLIGCVLGLQMVVAAPLPAQSGSGGADTAAVRAQGRPSAVPEPACCVIVRIDSQRVVVTARETATGFTFRFEPKTRRGLSSLKLGQPVWADFARNTVKLKARDTTACCAIIAQTSP